MSARTLITAQYQRFAHSFQARRWQWLAGFLVCGVLYSYIGLRIWRDWTTLNIGGFQLRYELFGLSWAMHTIGTFLAIWIWRSILLQMGYPLSFKRHVRVYSLSNLGRRLPGFVWWLVGRAYMYDRDGVSKLETSAGALLEMLLTAAAAAGVALLAGLASRATTTNVWLLLGLCVCFAGLLHPKLFALARTKFNLSARVPAIEWRYLLLWLLAEMAVITLGGTALYFMVAAIYPVPSWALFGAIQGWALLLVSGTVLVWLPIDFGISSGVLVLILSTFLSTPVAIVVTVAWRWWVAICELVWSFLGLMLHTPQPSSRS